MKKLIVSIFAVFIAAAMSAVEPTADILKLAVNYQAYPWTDREAPALTPTPEGYEPFHIEHYGRHGSRWHTGTSMYSRPVEYLAKAREAGKLTDRGQLLLNRLIEIKEQAKGRDGELTPLGARQHQQIAKRMYANFPEVFQESTLIDARSTVVIRCILSMENELRELHALNPRMEIHSDASESDMHYLNFNDTIIRKYQRLAQDSLKDFNKRHYNKKDFLKHLINDPDFARDSIDPRLFFNLFFYLANSQSHGYISPDYDVVSEEELLEQWRINNADWYMRYGNNSVAKGLGPYTQRNLLRNMIESADTALVSSRLSANLRFGHEVCVVPLVVLMELDDYNVRVEDFEQIADRWKNYEIFPMAANVQMVFYRPVAGDGDVLVKVMLNEREVRLPVVPVAGPYVRWADLRDFYMSKLDSFVLPPAP